ncbi:DUF6232 family protein [Caballeronia sp. LjRoot34]|uniref:DUF6232 family protein n=1 Tax=Caballeronia sp. LjRoot34 TaxID=3342325 RepID=UPI003ECF0036
MNSAASNVAQPNETVFFQRGNVSVTNARFIVPGQTYAMSNVTSIKHVETPPSKLPGWLLIIGGAVFCFGKIWVLGLLLIAGGAGVLWKAKGKYDVMLQTSSGEVRAFGSTDPGLVREIVMALNEAIVFRG